MKKLLKASYYFKNFNVDDLTVENKTLNIIFSDGAKSRFNLSKISTLTIKEDGSDKQFYIYSPEFENPVLPHIQTKEDAKRLKKALEHLIEILKTEKDTDPFGD